MVEVTGHPSGVEDQQPVRVRGTGSGGYLGGQPRLAHLAQCPVRVVVQHCVSHAEHVGRRGQLSAAQRGEVSGGSVQR